MFNLPYDGRNLDHPVHGKAVRVWDFTNNQEHIATNHREEERWLVEFKNGSRRLFFHAGRAQALCDQLGFLKEEFTSAMAHKWKAYLKCKPIELKKWPTYDPDERFSLIVLQE